MRREGWGEKNYEECGDFLEDVDYLTGLRGAGGFGECFGVVGHDCCGCVGRRAWKKEIFAPRLEDAKRDEFDDDRGRAPCLMRGSFEKLVGKIRFWQFEQLRPIPT